MTDLEHFDGVLVIGAGLAGLAAALSAAPRKALVLSPSPLAGVSASAWAQGGVAAALSEGDQPELHAADTIADPEFVQFHPTAIDVGIDPAPLATEALRGEGARPSPTAEGGLVVTA